MSKNQESYYVNMEEMEEEDQVEYVKEDQVEYVNVHMGVPRYACSDEDEQGYLKPVTAASTPGPCPHRTIECSHLVKPQPAKRNLLQQEQTKLLKANNASPSKNLPGKTFDVYIKPFVCKKTPPSFGDCLLAINNGNIEMRPKDNKTTFLSWPFYFIRRYGFDENSFTFEAGRRCDSGEGTFVFGTAKGKLINDEIAAEIQKRLQTKT